jgi:hypothetical protein
MESFAYPHFSSTVYVALFVNVTNAAKLRARIIRASTLQGAEGEAEREAVNFAFVDARLVCHRRYDMYVHPWTVRLSSRLLAGHERLTHSDGHLSGPSCCSTKYSED